MMIQLKNVMKAKVLLVLVFSMLTSFSFSKVNSEENPILVSLTLYIVNKHNQTANDPRSPDLSVSIQSHSLFFSNVDEEVTLMLYDNNGELVFTTVIYPTTTQVDLPANLLGDYELRLVADDHYYVGYIVI